MSILGVDIFWMLLIHMMIQFKMRYIYFINYTGPNSKRKILKSASFILTHDPVAKKRIEKITNAEVSAIYS